MKKILVFISVFALAVATMAQTLPENQQGGKPNQDTRSGVSVIYEVAPTGFISSLAVTQAVRVSPSDPASRAPSIVLTKAPDLGPWWQLINNIGGTYVYSNSFISPGDGKPIDLGMWLMVGYLGTPLPSIRFEIWGDNGGAPDPTNVLATTGSLAPAATGTLAFFSSPVLPGASILTNGSKYWFCATVVGEPFAIGGYQTGGHTQNSVYNDNGTFWFSNDPAGIFFDGQNYTPEMAFQVTIDSIPPSVPLTNWALYLGIFLMVMFTAIRFRKMV
ncbi:MAG: hypothetical protein IH598_16805 [Bacteroidales bacterium]|nr:hypothetical protein [Bacteroidales bacterium]